MKIINVLLLVVVTIAFCYGQNTPTFGAYNCTTSKWTVNYNTASGSYGMFLNPPQGSNTYFLLFSFNATSGGSGMFYLTAYTGTQFSIGSNTEIQGTQFAIYNTAGANTCPDIYNNFNDEYTRVVSLARVNDFGLNPLYRNRNLDYNAQLRANGTAQANLVNYTAIANTNFGVFFNVFQNPGAVVQRQLFGGGWDPRVEARELGVYLNVNFTQISSSRPVQCGNGLVDGSETCDDGNTANGDGCSSACTIETSYTCSQNVINATSVCRLNIGISPSNSASITPSNAASTTNTASANPSTSTGASPSSTSTASLVLVPIPSNSPTATPSRSVGSTASPSRAPGVSDSATASRSVGTSASVSPTASPLTGISSNPSTTPSATAGTPATTTPTAAASNSVTPSNLNGASPSTTSTSTATATATSTNSASTSNLNGASPSTTSTASVSFVPSTTNTPSATLGTSSSATPSASQSNGLPSFTSAPTDTSTPAPGGAANKMSSWVSLLF